MKKIIAILCSILLIGFFQVSNSEKIQNTCVENLISQTSIYTLSNIFGEDEKGIFIECENINIRFFQSTKDYTQYVLAYFDTQNSTHYIIHNNEVIYVYYANSDKIYHPFITPYLSSDGKNVLIWNRLSDNDETGEYFDAVKDVLGIYINGKRVFSPNYDNHKDIGSDKHDFYSITGLEYYFEGEEKYNFSIDFELQQKIDTRIKDLENIFETEVLYNRIKNMRAKYLERNDRNVLSKSEYIKFSILDYLHANKVIESLGQE